MCSPLPSSPFKVQIINKVITPLQYNYYNPQYALKINISDTIFTKQSAKCIFVIYCREEIEAERAKREYERLHMAGKTAEAQADLARLALVRREREEAARKREAEKEGEWCLLLACVGFQMFIMSLTTKIID